MILKIEPDRSITLPESFVPGDHVLLISREDGGYRLIPIIAATKEEFEEAVEDELTESARLVQQLAKKLRHTDVQEVHPLRSQSW